MTTITLKNRKVGGIRFIRIGSHQFSHCLTRKPAEGRTLPMAAILLATAISGLTALAGVVSLAPAKAAAVHKSYELIKFTGDESDIVDSGLSIDDCIVILPTMRAAGDSVTCRSVASN